MGEGVDAAFLSQVPCPVCGHVALTIERRLRAKPIGAFSLAGAQMKVTATTVFVLVCTHCGVEAEGEVEPVMP